MAVFNFTITDPLGVDLSLFFPGLLPIELRDTETDPPIYATTFYLAKNGVVDQSRWYGIRITGTDLDGAAGGGLTGNITSAVLTVNEDGVLPRQLASLSVTLGGYSSAIGGVIVNQVLDMTPDTLMRWGMLDGAALFSVVGGTGNDRIIGSGWADQFDGGKGRDRMEGRGGNDFYFVDNIGDVVVEAAGGGSDTVFAYASYTLTAGSAVETLLAQDGTLPINLTGNSLGQKLIGNDGTNKLLGLAGNDTLDGGIGGDHLDGGVGNDTLIGGLGKDTLIGGAGRDSLSGGGQADTFVFTRGASGITTTTADTVTVWNADDLIDSSVRGTAANYAERATTATTIEAAAAFAEKTVTSTAVAHVFLYNAAKSVGYLLSDLDNNETFETGVVLRWASAASDLHYTDII